MLPKLRNTMLWVKILAPPLPPSPALLASSGTSKAGLRSWTEECLAWGHIQEGLGFSEQEGEASWCYPAPVVDTLSPEGDPFGGLSCPPTVLSPDPGHPGSG